MLIAVVILLSYFVSLLVAGHGVAPMGLLLILSVMQSTDAWFSPVIIAGWVGVIGLICATFLFRLNPSKQLTFQFLSSVILYLSWLVMAILSNDESGSLFGSFILSSPFQAAFFFVVYRFWIQRRQMGANVDNLH